MSGMFMCRWYLKTGDSDLKAVVIKIIGLQPFLNTVSHSWLSISQTKKSYSPHPLVSRSSEPPFSRPTVDCLNPDADSHSSVVNQSTFRVNACCNQIECLRLLLVLTAQVPSVSQHSSKPLRLLVMKALGVLESGRYSPPPASRSNGKQRLKTTSSQFGK